MEAPGSPAVSEIETPSSEPVAHSSGEEFCADCCDPPSEHFQCPLCRRQLPCTEDLGIVVHYDIDDTVESFDTCLVCQVAYNKAPHKLEWSQPDSRKDTGSVLEEEPPTIDSYAETPAKPARTPLDWAALQARTPPERAWAIDYWLGMGHVTLLAGGAGVGKTNVAQALGSCLTLRREYLDFPPSHRRVLMWACEDSEEELWRRQVAIAKWLGAPLTDFAGKFIALSYDGQLVELAALLEQRRLSATPMLSELRQQIGDYKADVVLLDNVARLYGGNENDRHQVTSFIAMLTGAAAPTGAAVLLLGHPGKAAGSEYSGSTAWEAAVRARWYLGRTLPGAKGQEEEGDARADDGVRYLARRKSNYGPRDWRRLHYREGVMVAEAAPEAAQRATLGDGYKRDVVATALRKLAEMKQCAVAASNSPDYLPRLAEQYQLLDRLSEKEFATTMRAMRKDGTIVTAPVGQYSNRTTRDGLAMKEDLHK